MFRSLLGKDSSNTGDSMNEPMDAEDTKLVVCVEPECGKAFELAAGEMTFYTTRGLDIPKRCKPCRVERNQQQSLRKTKSNTRQNYSPHEIICENCNKTATVPFPPAPGKPVYCKICWEGIKNLPLSAQRP